MKFLRRLSFACIAAVALFSTAHAANRPNIEAIQCALQERYQKYMAMAEANHVDIDPSFPEKLTFPVRLRDGASPGAYPEKGFYDADLINPDTGQVNNEVAEDLIADLINNFTAMLPEEFVLPETLRAIDNLSFSGTQHPIPTNWLVQPPVYPGTSATDDFEVLVKKIGELRHPHVMLVSASEEGSVTTGPYQQDGSTVGVPETTCSEMRTETELNWTDPEHDGRLPYALLGRAESATRVTESSVNYYSGYLRTVSGRHVLVSAPYTSGTFQIFERQLDYALFLSQAPDPVGFPGATNISLTGTSAPYTEFNRWKKVHDGSISSSTYLGPVIGSFTSPTLTPACPTADGSNCFGWFIQKIAVFTPTYEHNDLTPYIDTCAESCSVCTLGDANVGLNSLHFSVGLGNDAEGSSGSIRLEQQFASMNMAHPYDLSLRTDAGAEVIHEGDPLGAVRQIKSAQGLVDFVVTQPFKSYQMRFYEAADVGAKNSSGFYTTTNPAYKTISVTNPNVSWYVNPTIQFQNYLTAPSHGVPASGSAYPARFHSSNGNYPSAFYTIGSTNYSYGVLSPKIVYYIGSLSGQPNLLILYFLDGSTLRQLKFTSADSTSTFTVLSAANWGSLDIVETGGAYTKAHEYDYVKTGTLRDWTLTQKVDGTTIRTDRKTENEDFNTTTQTYLVNSSEWTLDGSSATIAKKSTVHQIFPWNDYGSTWESIQGELISEVNDPDSAALTTGYSYYTSSTGDGVNYTRLKEIVRPDGGWERYVYDNKGRTTRVLRSYKGSSPSWDYTGNEVVDYLYDQTVTLPDSSTGTMTRTISSLDSQEVSRSYEVTSDETANSLRHTISVRVRNTGATWDDSSNLTTHTWTQIGGTFDGRVVREVQPDGTASLYSYSSDPTTGHETTTVRTGKLDTATNTITRGTKTVTETNAKGGQVSTITYDIGTAGETLISSADGIEFDDFGRPREIHYLDGTVHHYDYGCCGLDSETDREGVVTTYINDAEKRPQKVTRAGVTTETVYDILGRARLVKRYPDGQPSAAIVLSETNYDVAGRVSYTRSYGRQTGYVETPQTAQRKTVRVTTLPFKSAWTAAERGTISETAWADGRVERETGTASAARRYDYGTATLAEASSLGYASGTRFQTITETLLDENNADTDEVVTRYLDPLGRAVKVRYADGAASYQKYNDLGQLVRQTDPDGVQTLFAYDDLGERNITVLDMNRDGNWSYVSLDRVTKATREIATRTDGGQSFTVRRVKTEAWLTDNQDAPRELNLSDVSLNGLTSWQTTNGLTTKTVTAYDAANATRTETTTYPDKTSLVRVFVNGRPSSETGKNSAGQTVSSAAFGYDDHGRSDEITDSLGRTTTTTYHADDQIQTVTTPDPDTSRSGTGYDAQTTTYTYDEAGRAWKVEQHDGAITETTYWGNGKVKRIAGGRTYPQAYTHDAQGRVKTLTTWQDYAGQTGAAVTTWNYDPERGWLASKEYNDGKGPSYEYTNAGRLFTRTWARTVSGQPLFATYGYNNAGELNSINYSDTTPDITHTYDRGGRPLTTTDAAGLLTRSYDPASLRLSSEAYTGTGELSGRSIARSYDYLQRPQSVATDGGYSFGYGYDTAGRLGTVSQGFHSALFSYEAGTSRHERTVIKRVGVERLRRERALDRVGRVASVTTTVGGTPRFDRDYDYNDANQRTKVVLEDGRRWAFGYDDLGQVNSAKKRLDDNVTTLPGYDFGYTFDDIGNRTQTTANGRIAAYAPDSALLNRYDSRAVPGAVDVRGEAITGATVTVETLATTRTGKDFYREVSAANGSAPINLDIDIEATRTTPPETLNETRAAFVPQTPEIFVHDDDGNLKQDGHWDYTWDAENRLSRMETLASIVTSFPALKKRLNFAYDSQGRRIRKLVETWDAAANGGAGGWAESLDLRFLYDGWNLIAELDANNGNALVRSHAWGLDLSGTRQGAGGVGGLLWTNTATHSFAAVSDANGNVTDWINTATLATSGRADYGAFGEPVLQTGVARSLPFGFSSKYADEETGLNYYGYRFYNPETGRWLGRDPVEEDGGINILSMVGNDTINRWDFLGLSCGCIFNIHVAHGGVEGEDSEHLKAIKTWQASFDANQAAYNRALADYQRQMGEWEKQKRQNPAASRPLGLSEPINANSQRGYGLIGCQPNVANKIIADRFGARSRLFADDLFIANLIGADHPLITDPALQKLHRAKVGDALLNQTTLEALLKTGMAEARKTAEKWLAGGCCEVKINLTYSTSSNGLGLDETTGQIRGRSLDAMLREKFGTEYRKKKGGDWEKLR